MPIYPSVSIIRNFVEIPTFSLLSSPLSLHSLKRYSGLNECILTDGNTLGKSDLGKSLAHVEAVFTDCGYGVRYGYGSNLLKSVERASTNGGTNDISTMHVANKLT